MCNSLRTNCVQRVNELGQKPADKHAQVVPSFAVYRLLDSFTRENSAVYTPPYTLFRAGYPQAEIAFLPKLIRQLSSVSPGPIITTITYI